ncbi:AbrB/MazE/SpoVT family DNA-binding domain-containing protein, partial [Candidatus Bipolaricaulota bacterium]|nr:AbrB/MazE/SpoVT family DNA-binding domain-containing protein [Candidatus Bipolaricaulota bacterium]
MSRPGKEGQDRLSLVRMVWKSMTKVKRVKLGRKGQVVIPKEVREALGLREG